MRNHIFRIAVCSNCGLKYNSAAAYFIFLSNDALCPNCGRRVVYLDVKKDISKEEADV
jgi:DNA-directed RNA polymerase subunit RPC12/RpoP